MKNQWQDTLRDRMERHEEPAPEGLWNSIEQIVSGENINKTLPAKRKIIPLWTQRIAAVAAIALILFYIGLHTLNESRKDVRIAELEQVETSAPETFTPKTEPVVKIEEQLLVQRTEGKKPESTKTLLVAETNAHTAVPETTESSRKNEQQHLENKTGAPKETQNQHPVNNNQEQPVLRTDNAPGFQLPTNRRYRKPAKWQTDLYASNIPSGASRKHDGYGSFRIDESQPGEEIALASTRSTDSPDGTPAINSYQHVYTDIKHLQPITLGVSMKYNFAERWSATSGLTYTILSSQLRSGTDNHYHNSHQMLHYVGIPLSVNYTVWKNSSISTYLLGGGLVEKNVSGTLSTDFVIDSKLETHSQHEISVKQLQWSVNSAVGIQYQIAKNIGIYAEPGIAYYFKNKSDVETIYKEKPLNFNLRLGLRFSLNE